jgi:leucyl/phenylalanyl-tRNA--protein transferase
MVLRVSEFRLHRSLRKSLVRFSRARDCEIRFDSAFQEVMQACAASRRSGQQGTWITAEMLAAYAALHAAGLAHSVETWVRGELVGGLYCVAMGQAVFGESMFSRVSDASKTALAALVCFCRAHGIVLIDCQQNTRHLASLGAREMARAGFVQHLAANVKKPAPPWRFDSLYWEQLLTLSA